MKTMRGKKRGKRHGAGSIARGRKGNADQGVERKPKGDMNQEESLFIRRVKGKAGKEVQDVPPPIQLQPGGRKQCTNQKAVEALGGYIFMRSRAGNNGDLIFVGGAEKSNTVREVFARSYMVPSKGGGG